MIFVDGAADDPRWIAAMARLVATKRVKKIEVAKIDSLPPAEVPDIRDLLLANGFKQGYKGPTLR